MLKSYTTNLLLLCCLCFFIGCINGSKKEYDWQHEDGFRWSELSHDPDRNPGFEKRAASHTGISFRNRLTDEDIAENRHYLNGSGVALADVDGDGWTDIYFARLNGPNKLYKNLGNFKFRDITADSGVAHEGYYSTGVVFADVNGNGHPDLLVTSLNQENTLYINDGTGKFVMNEESGLGESNGSHTMALADIDGDGDLDLYVANYKKKNVLDLFDVKDLSWEKTIKEEYDPKIDQTYTLFPPYGEHYTIIHNENSLPERREIGRKDALYINMGDGTFEKAADTEHRFLDANGNSKGFEEDWGLTAKFHDINKDGLPDLYVNNDFWTKDRIWINQGEGIFRELDPLAIRNMSFSSMAVDFSDVNRDGSWDFFVTEMLSSKHEGKLRQFIPKDPHPNNIGQYDNQPQYNRNSFYLNRGAPVVGHVPSGAPVRPLTDPAFDEISYFSGLEASEWSWAARFLDVDLDGYEDLLITTGYSYDVQDLDAQEEWKNEMARNTPAAEGSDLHIFPSLELRNRIFRNNGNLTFSDVSMEWGFTEKDISHGMAFADLDNDGDLDLVINRLNDEAVIFENRSSAPRITVRLIGSSPNTKAIGANVQLNGGPVPQQKELSAGGDYLSGSDPLAVFAADWENPNHRITVTWPSGEQSMIDSIRANRIYEISEETISKKEVKVKSSSTIRQTIFEDVSDRLNHWHHEEPYDDFIVQPLLPVKLSQQGPGISWIDFDGDGDDDLFIASGRGGSLSVYENRGNGEFISVDPGNITSETSSDQTTILGWKSGQGTDLVIGNANFEPGDINVSSALHYTFREGMFTEQDSIPGIFSTTGPLTAADYDGDGHPDLFVGGRFVPTQYPSDATSRLFKSENGRFVPDEINSEKLKEIGLVTSAVFTDFNLDGKPDLLLAREWDSIVLLENRDGVFYDVSSQVGLDEYKGWWNGITTGDFTGNGRPDIAATNIGLNSSWQQDADRPLRMYYTDLNRDRRIDIFESYYNPDMEVWVPRRQLHEYESVAAAFSTAFGSNEQFANASIDEILRFNLDRVSLKEINTLETMIFINTGAGFEARQLPAEVQFTAAFYAGVADFDNDGFEDLFLSQNFFRVRPNTTRLDAGRGLWLKGDGDGNFEAVPGEGSGIMVYGEQRGAALGDFNGDARVDLAVSQNGAETKLFTNRTEKPGIRIRLDGPEGNMDGIGSAIRLIYEDGSKGPRREIQAGSGYWSQNSAVQVMGYSEMPSQIEVTWFDGRVDVIDIIEDRETYLISRPDSVR